MKNREIVITVLGNNYKVAYPNVGQMIDLSIRENVLAKGQFKDLIMSGLPDHMESYAMIKTIAFIDIMLPQLVKDLKTENLLDLDPVDFQEISNVYFETIMPWLDEWRKSILEAPKKENVLP